MAADLVTDPFGRRLRVLRTYIDDLGPKTRAKIKRALTAELNSVKKDAINRMIKLTPERKPDDATTMEYRGIGWSKYGVQDWVVKAVAQPSERQMGMTLRQGFLANNRKSAKEESFEGSTKNFIQLTSTISNAAPHASMYFNDTVIAREWEIPGERGLAGDRRAMLWSYNGRPVFRWAYYPTTEYIGLFDKSPWRGPITISRGYSKDKFKIINEAQDAYESLGDKLYEIVEKHTKGHFKDYR